MARPPPPGLPLSHSLQTSAEALRRVPHRLPHESQIVLVCGQKGYGKTWWLRHYAMAESRILVLDLHDEFPQVRRRMDYRRAIADLSEGGPCWRRVIPPDDIGSAREYGESVFAACVAGLRDCLLVVPEVSAYTKTKGGIEGTALETLVLRGRHYGIRMACDIQRLNRVPGEIHSEMTEAVIFHTRRPRDLDVLEMWGFENAHAIAPTMKRGQVHLIHG